MYFSKLRDRARFVKSKHLHCYVSDGVVDCGLIRKELKRCRATTACPACSTC
ncbi:hypothetical protein C7S16_4393 [Burkholderia thailandensis]|uniref:Uncharacterized protein n=1 Tax=Burkholderia thailandensis TaxID=57975 RepID=A0AAW9CPD4_BURTH|nr:hypothetical protein [Burkholderia thailandensis]MDW9252728.1 hypothetical protein [Burkholderia thailandensis]